MNFTPFIHSLFLSNGATAPSGSGPPHCRGITITLRYITFCRTPLDEWSAWHRDLYLKTHNIHKRQTSMPPAGYEPTIPASERLQTHALDQAATCFDILPIGLKRYALTLPNQAPSVYVLPPQWETEYHPRKKQVIFSVGFVRFIHKYAISIRTLLTVKAS
jgi:hypothetical protein